VLGVEGDVVAEIVRMREGERVKIGIPEGVVERRLVLGTGF
jgi:hypothetical protein